MAAVIAAELYREYVAIDAAERERLAAQAEIVDQNLARQLAAVRAALFSIRTDQQLLRDAPEGEQRMTHHLEMLASVMPGVRTFHVDDARGIATSASREGIVGDDFSSRDYFQSPKANPDPDMLFVSPPFTTSLGAFAMNLSVAILDEHGAFTGVVSATLAPEYFRTLLESVRYTSDTWTSLGHGDGKVFIFAPEGVGKPGTDIAKPGSFFPRHRDSGQTATVMTGTVYATGEPRMMAQRTIQPPPLKMNKPLLLAVARDQPSIHARWRQNATYYGGLFSILAATSCLGLFVYQRRQRAFATEAERTARDLERQHALSRAVIDSLPGVFYLISAEGRFTLWNRNLETVTETPTKDMPITSPLDFFVGEDRDLIEQRIKQTFTQGSADAEAMLVSRGGLKTPYYFTALRVELDGQPYLIGTGLDVSERRQSERMLAQQNEQLARSNADLEQFAHVSSHDLREPLRMVTNFAQLLERRHADRLDAEGLEFLRYLTEGARRMDQLIIDLLEYSRVGHRDEPFAVHDLGVIVADAIANLRTAVDEAEARIVPPRVWPTVVGDRHELSRLVQNLIDNALKYRDPNRPCVIELSVTRQDGQWRFAVSDNGIGIDPRYFERIFMIFQRLHTREHYDGTGIGLAICKKIAEHHGGGIEVASVPGRGSTFTVTLPAAD